MNRKQKLQAKRAELLLAARAILDKPDATAEETAKAQGILATDIPEIDAQLEQIDRLEALERTAPAIPGSAASPSSPVTVTDRREQDPMRGFRSAGEFARAVHAASAPGGAIDPRLQFLRREAQLDAAGGIQAAPSNYHEEGHSSDGYMVPPEIRQAIWKLVFSEDDLFGATNPEPTSSNSIPFLRDESTPWGATGIQAKWRAEASQMTASRLATDPSQMRLHELYAFVTATDELLQDAPLVNSRITQGAGAAIQYKLGEAFVRGTGAGQPLGYETAGCLISVAKESGQAAATLLPKNILKMYSRRLVMPGSRWAWLMNSDVVPQLVDLKIGNEPSWVGQNQGLQNAPAGMLLGLPIRFTEHCKTLGTVGDIALVDFAGYYSAIRSGGVRFDSSIHLFFDYGVTAFRWTVRVGGQPFLSAAVSPAQGSNTKSHFIVLDTRA